LEEQKDMSETVNAFNEPRADDAEQAVLGICLLSEKAATETVRLLKKEDFYEPTHQVIFDSLTRLVDQRKPTDAVSIWNQIQADGTEKILQDGPSYLHTLYSAAPPATALNHHVELVKDAGARRQLMRLGALSQTMAAAKNTGSAAVVLETIKNQLDSITSEVMDNEISSFGETFEEAIAEVERIGEEGAVVGIPTGFPELDNKLHGLRPGQMIMVAGRPAMGKALDINTLIPTPEGFTLLNDLMEGDFVFDENGKPTKVVEVFETLYDRKCHEIIFSEKNTHKKTRIIADEEHLWPVFFDGKRTSATTLDLMHLDSQRLHYDGKSTGPNGVIYDYEIESISPVVSRPVKCIRVDNPTHLYLATEHMVPTHNSTVMLDFVRNAAFNHGKSVLVFSLEMSRMEVMMRCMSAQARIELSHLQTGKMSDEEWQRLARAHGKMTNAKLGIDDAPGTTIMDIRAKARWWQNKYGLDLIAIDYLQLMNSHRKIESRQQEVSEISRNIKLIAKEFGVPVLALSQLNRGSEQRTDKKPMLSDLRESGCLTGDTRILTTNNTYVSFDELMENGYEGIEVWSYDSNMKLTAAKITNVFYSGVKKVYDLALATGKHVKASANHKFYTLNGEWVALEDLSIGDVLAVCAPSMDIDNPSSIPMWEKIVDIKELEEVAVYDATVEGTHNFIAEGIIAHNSLEQDSDVVIMVHREEFYNPEQRVGEADLIIGKQRAGPTGIVPVVAQLHYSRFVPAAHLIPLPGNEPLPDLPNEEQPF
jgi:replicative DNA helicase